MSRDDHQEPTGMYEIHVAGHLDARWSDWFEGLNFTRQSDGTTVLSGRVVDQAALHGVLRRVRDLGLPLIAVVQVNRGQARGPASHAAINHGHSGGEADM